MSNIISTAENGQRGSFENRPTEQLVQSYSQGKWISNKELEELAIEKYKINGKGITFEDVIENFIVKRKSSTSIKECMYKTC